MTIGETGAVLEGHVECASQGQEVGCGVILWVSDRRPMAKTRKDFQRLAQLRAAEAAFLARGNKKQGAYYLAGFAIECALKACIAKKTRKHDFPSRNYVQRVHSHDLNELLKLAGLEGHFDADTKTRPGLSANWGVVMGWNIDSRYECSGLNGKDMATAVTSPTDGVLQWIKLYW